MYQCQAVGGAQAGNRLTLPVTAGANTNVRNVIFQNMTVVIMDPANPAFTVKAIVTQSGAATPVLLEQMFVDVIPYTRAAVNADSCCY